jgi:hypothetical protein
MPSYTQTAPASFTVPDGKYTIEIEHAETKISQPPKNNEYIRMKCRVQMKDGTQGPAVYDNMVFTVKSAWKIDQVREALGASIIPGEPANVEPEDLIGKRATVILKTDPDTDRNIVDRWVTPKELAAVQTAMKSPAPKDGDDIPF